MAHSESVTRPLNGWQIRRELTECLTNVQVLSSFALFEQMPNPPNPGLDMKNGGLVGLPLSDRDAQVIVAASHAAPFGKGEHTIVDESVRKTWEVSPTDFSITNPAWDDFLQLIVKRVTKGLGVSSNGLGVSAELYKMLLYEEGAMFKPHQDSEKAPRMFGTLVLALPSQHEGGDVRVTHAGETKIFETSKYSAFDSSYLAWFADVTHEVRPVLSGRRLVLTYNLIHTTLGSKELSAESNKGLIKVSSVLDMWKTNLESMTPELPSAMAFLFEHQYTDANISFDGLKGHDRQVGSLLREACEQAGFIFYLANLKRTVEGGCDEEDDYYGSKEFHPITEECDRETILQKVVHLDGTEVTKDLEFDDENFIQEEPFESIDPDEEDYSGYTGNEGVSATHFYSRTVAVIMPKNRRMDFLFNPSEAARRRSSYMYWAESKVNAKAPKVLEMIEQLSDSINRGHSNSSVRDDLEQLCQMVIRRMREWKNSPPPLRSYGLPKEAPFSNEVVRSVAKASLKLGNRNTFLDAFELCSKAIEPTDIGIAIQRYDIQSWLSKLTQYISTLTNFTDRIEFLYHIRDGLNKEAEDCSKNAALYQKWLDAQLCDAVESTVIASTLDGITLAKLSVQLPPGAMFEKVMPKVRQNAETFNTRMIVGFLAQVMEGLAEKKVPEENATTIFHEIMPILKSSFSLSVPDDTLPSKPPASPFGPAFGRVKPEPVPNIPDYTGISTAELLCHCQSLGYEAEVTEIISHIIKEANAVDIGLFEVLYLKMLKRIISFHETKGISISKSPFSRLFVDLLTIYIVRYIKTEPMRPKDWAMPKVNCSCSDCAKLNAFLVDPKCKVGNFPVGKQRRYHLQGKLSEAKADCTHETLHQGSPHPLIVTKQKNKYKALKKAWDNRRYDVKKHLVEMGDGPLKSLLGDKFDVIYDLDMARLSVILVVPTSPSSSSSMLASSESVGNRVLPPLSKRKIPGGEVIIIDDD